MIMKYVGFYLSAIILFVIGLILSIYFGGIANSIITLILIVNFVTLLICLTGSYFLFKKLNLKIDTIFVVVTTLLFSFLFVGINLILFSPLPTVSQARSDSEVNYWNLDVSYQNDKGEKKVQTRTAYKLFPAVDSVQKQPTPIIYLHGGPGGYAIGPDFIEEFYSQFTQLGYDVYIYDQVGSGFSNRLENIDDYDFRLFVEELEQIRIKIGAEKLTLLGESWGGTLASIYSSVYPENVEKIVFINPGELDISLLPDLETDYSKTGLKPELELQSILNLLNGKIFLSNRWSQSNPALAKSILSDQEADAKMDTVANIQKYSLACDAKNVPQEATSGFGFWSLMSTSTALANRNDRPIEKIKQNQYQIPILFIKSECDFLSPKIIEQYREAYSNFKLVELKGAGHVPYLENSQETTKAIEEFLLNPQN
jgi:proline iminopeptidase